MSELNRISQPIRVGWHRGSSKNTLTNVLVEFQWVTKRVMDSPYGSHATCTFLRGKPFSVTRGRGKIARAELLGNKWQQFWDRELVSDGPLARAPLKARFYRHPSTNYPTSCQPRVGRVRNVVQMNI